MKKIHRILLVLALLALLLSACAQQKDSAGQSVPQDSAASAGGSSSAVGATSPDTSRQTSSAPAESDDPASSLEESDAPVSSSASSPASSSASLEESGAPANSDTASAGDSQQETADIDAEEMLTIEEGDEGTTCVFSALPQNAAELQALCDFYGFAPEHTAAFCIAALCRYPACREDSLAMIDLLRGPNPMNEADRQFIADRFREKDYVPRSYFAGAAPDNDYTPTEPYTLTVTADAHSYDTENVVRLYVQSGGADSPRPLSLRLGKDGNWYLWEYSSILVGIRLPASEDPWA